MKKFLSARYDKVFKAVFGDEENLDLTKRLLELILHQKVENIKIRNPELIKRYAYEKGKTADLILEVDESIVVQMEMNFKYTDWLHFRNFNFFSVTINKDAKKGEEYKSKKYYLLVDFTYGKASDTLMEDHSFQSSSQKKYLDNVSVLEFSMDEMGRKWYNENDEDARTLFRYLSIFDMNEAELNALPRGEDEFMDKFRDKVIELNQNEDFVRFASDEEDMRMMLNSEHTEGREERNIEIAKSMLEKSDVAYISEVTGLSIEDIEKLKEA